MSAIDRVATRVPDGRSRPSLVRALRTPRFTAAAPKEQKPRGGDVEITLGPSGPGGLMSFAPFALVILAALIHATWNLLSKRAAAGGAAFVFAYNLVACAVYAPWVAWLLARGALTWSMPVAGCILLSGLIHLAYSLCLLRGYQVADLSVVYPIARGTGPMLSFLGAVLLLGELPSAQGVLGLLAVVVGIGLIAMRGDLSAFGWPSGKPACAGA